MRKVAVILPTKDNYYYLMDALASFMDSTSYSNYRIMIVNANTNKEPIFKGISVMEIGLEKHPKIKIIDKTWEGGNNIRCVNEAIKLTEKDEDIILIHDDMQFFKIRGLDWLELIANSNLDLSKIGLMTYLDSIKVAGPEYNGITWIGSWFCYIPRETINAVGLFDEDFPIGEDIDYSYRVQKAGRPLVQTRFWFNHHQLRETPHTDQSEEVKKMGVELFKKKYANSG